MFVPQFSASCEIADSTITIFKTPVAPSNILSSNITVTMELEQEYHCPFKQTVYVHRNNHLTSKTGLFQACDWVSEWQVIPGAFHREFHCNCPYGICEYAFILLEQTDGGDGCITVCNVIFDVQP